MCTSPLTGHKWPIHLWLIEVYRWIMVRVNGSARSENGLSENIRYICRVDALL